MEADILRHELLEIRLLRAHHVPNLLRKENEIVNGQQAHGANILGQAEGLKGSNLGLRRRPHAQCCCQGALVQHLDEVRFAIP